MQAAARLNTAIAIPAVSPSCNLLSFCASKKKPRTSLAYGESSPESRPLIEMEPRPLALQLSLLLAGLFVRCTPADFVDYASAHEQPFSSTSTHRAAQQQHQLAGSPSSSIPSLEGEGTWISVQGAGNVNPVEQILTMERALSHFVTCEVISSQEKVRVVIELTAK